MSQQFSTFYLGKRWYGIDVMQVQEVTKTLPVTRIPLAPVCVKGLINLRGQIATAIGLSDLFALKDSAIENPMNVICSSENVLLSLLVERIGDVVDASHWGFESAPETIDPKMQRFLKGVYKTEGPLLSILDLNSIRTSLETEQE